MINERVELWLKTCCSSLMHDRTICRVLPGEICWYVNEHNWNLLDNFLQVIRLTEGEKIRVEVFDVMCDDYTPEMVEELPSDVSLKELHLKLAELAGAVSRKHLNLYLIEDWQKQLNDAQSKHLKDSSYRAALGYNYYLFEETAKLLQEVKRFAGGETDDEFTIQYLEGQIQYLEGQIEKNLRVFLFPSESK